MGGLEWNVGECCVSQWTCVDGSNVGCYTGGGVCVQVVLNTSRERMGGVN